MRRAVFALEHGRAAYWADYAAYGSAVLVLAAWLFVRAPRDEWPSIVATTLAGLAGWTLVEYGMHRFVLHGLEPFRSWHAKHHERPLALISTPTLLSAALIATLVFVPELVWGGPWRASALTLGLTVGYLGYAITHHAIHHWRADNAWLKQRKRWHARHHHASGTGCYGVSSSLWDHVFGTTGATASRR